MARSRGLITDTERDRISRKEDVDDAKRYQAVSRVRRRIKEELPEDVELLAENETQLLNELREVVCDPQRAEDGVVRFKGIENYGSGRHSITVKFYRTPGEDTPSIEIHRVVNEESSNWFDTETIEAIEAGEYEIQLLSSDSGGRGEWLLDAEIASYPIDSGTWEITEIEVYDAEEAWKDGE